MDYQALPTPASCYADFCLIPVGTGSVSVANEVAEVQKLLQASGLAFTMHSAGTTVGTSTSLQPPFCVIKTGDLDLTEGSWDHVMRVIGQAHSLVHKKGVVRVQTSMRIGTRWVLAPCLRV